MAMQHDLKRMKNIQLHTVKNTTYCPWRTKEMKPGTQWDEELCLELRTSQLQSWFLTPLDFLTTSKTYNLCGSPFFPSGSMNLAGEIACKVILWPSVPGVQVTDCGSSLESSQLIAEIRKQEWGTGNQVPLGLFLCLSCAGQVFRSL